MSDIETAPRPQGPWIAGYQVLDELGRGGYGRVYRALDPKIERQVAIKLLTEVEPETVQRFRREAAAIGRLNHPNIVVVFDTGQHKDKPYFVMELLSGESLQALLEREGALSPRVAVAIMRQVAAGLSYAHRFGVIHRDVKPGNIQILPGGTVKIMDFGIARLSDETTRLTKANYVVGTLPYMAPEQVSGQTVDQRADIFSFGVMFYEMIAGTKPFPATTPVQLVEMMRRRQPDDLRKLCPACPPDLERIIDRTLEWKAELRYQTLDDLILDLDAVGIELQREEAKVLTGQARSLLTAGNIDRAEETLRAALRLDPSDVAARGMLSRLRTDRQRQISRQKAEEMLRNARHQIAERQFASATQLLEDASRVAPDHTGIQQLLVEARDLSKRQQEVEQRLERAKVLYQERRLRDALDLANSALVLDADDPAAQNLVQRISTDLERERREEVIVRGLQEGRRLMFVRNWTKAVETLRQLHQSFPERSEIAALLMEAEAEAAKAEKQRTLDRAKETCRALLAEERFREAIHLLEEFIDSQSSDVEVVELLASARRANQEKLQRETLDQALKKAEDYLSHGRAEDALRILEQHRGIVPGDPRPNAAIERALRMLAVQNQEAELRKLIEEAENLIRAADPRGALELLLLHRNEYASYPTLALRAEALERDARRIEQDRSVSSGLNRCARLVHERGVEAGIAFLVELQKTYPEDARIGKHLSALQDQAQEAERKRLRVETILSRVAELMRSNQLDEAVSAIEAALVMDAGEPRLVDALDTALKARTQRERAANVRSILDRSTHLAKIGSLQEAISLVDATLRLYPSDPQLIARMAELREQANAEAQAAELDRIESNIRSLIADGSVGGALGMLESAMVRFPNEQRFAPLLEQARQAQLLQEERQYVAQQLRIAIEQQSRGDLASAENVLLGALQVYPKRREFLEELERIRGTMAEASARRRQEFCERIAREFRLAIQRDDAKRAQKLLDDGFRKYPNAATWQTLNEELESHRLRRSALRRANDRIDAKDWTGAERILAEYLGMKPGDSDATMMLGRLSRLREDAEREAEFKARLDRVRGLLALELGVDAIALLETFTEQERQHPQVRAMLRQAKKLSVRRKTQFGDRAASILWIARKWSRVGVSVIGVGVLVVAFVVGWPLLVPVGVLDAPRLSSITPPPVDLRMPPSAKVPGGETLTPAAGAATQGGIERSPTAGQGRANSVASAFYIVPGTIDFEVAAEADSPIYKRVRLETSGGPLAVTLVPDESWIVLRRYPTTIPATIDVGIDPQEFPKRILDGDSLTGKILVTPDQTGAPPQTLTIVVFGKR
jgi:serine/threonine-protein kinase